MLPTVLRNESNEVIFEVPARVKSFSHLLSLYEDGFELAEWFGPYRIYASWDFGSSTTTLVFARVNGKEYGTMRPDEVKSPPDRPSEIVLEQNYPNPFNPTTVISYQIPAASHVTLKVYDVLGREMAVLVNGPKSPGYYQAILNGRNLRSGVYFYRLQVGNYTAMKKLLLLK